MTGAKMMPTGGSHITYKGKREELLASVRETYESGLELIDRKNRDYGANDDPFRNFRGAAFLGLRVEQGILLRVLDKLSRVANLLDHEASVKDETMDDTIVDCINYLAILKAFREITTSGAGAEAKPGSVKSI